AMSRTMICSSVSIRPSPSFFAERSRVPPSRHALLQGLSTMRLCGNSQSARLGDLAGADRRHHVPDTMKGVFLNLRQEVDA
ncbi:MAG: hypothetical protein AAFZ09_05125, partial [Pseudomonadota bacterium]